MKSIGQLLIGLFVAAGIGMMVLSALSLALVEGGIPVAAVPTLPPSPTVPEATPAPGETIAPTQVQPTLCPAPAGWEAYTIMGGDNLQTLAQLTGASVDEILQGNCLVSSSLLPGTVLYLPRIITPTATETFAPPTATPCGPPANWVRYTVQPGDTLYRISQWVGVSVYQLQLANCMRGTMITAGTRLFVPFMPPTRTPQPPTVTPTIDGVTVTVAPPTITNTPGTPVPATPTETQIPTETVEPTVAPTEAPTETPTTPAEPTVVVEPGSPVTEVPAP